MSSARTIKEIRITLGMNQEEFGNLLGVTKGNISKYESEKRKPRMKVYRKLKELAEENNIDIDPKDFFDF